MLIKIIQSLNIRGSGLNAWLRWLLTLLREEGSVSERGLENLEQGNVYPQLLCFDPRVDLPSNFYRPFARPLKDTATPYQPHQDHEPNR